jgi:hypothetical protein
MQNRVAGARRAGMVSATLAREGTARAMLVYAAAAACVVASLSPALAGEMRGVVELFTSQGCSSCPPADKLLGQLAGDPSLVALSLPVDYWDYLGWKDTLADPRNSARQRAYAQVRGDREVYTPQAVINGAVHALGSDKDAIEEAIDLSRSDKTTLTLPIAMTVADGRVAVAVPGRPEIAPAEVWLCGLAKAVTVAIGRGENRGRSITYHNVARSWLKLGTWGGKDQTWNVAFRDFGGDNLDEAAVIIQTGTIDRPSAMLGAAAATLH